MRLELDDGHWHHQADLAVVGVDASGMTRAWMVSLLAWSARDGVLERRKGKPRAKGSHYRLADKETP